MQANLQVSVISHNRCSSFPCYNSITKAVLLVRQGPSRGRVGWVVAFVNHYTRGEGNMGGDCHHPILIWLQNTRKAAMDGKTALRAQAGRLHAGRMPAHPIPPPACCWSASRLRASHVPPRSLKAACKRMSMRNIATSHAKCVSDQKKVPLDH
jgi:hypothetical protein